LGAALQVKYTERYRKTVAVLIEISRAVARRTIALYQTGAI
jgi:hypothetical protein